MKNLLPTALLISAFVLGAFCAAGLVGCASANQTGGYSHGALTVKGHSDAQIREATKAVFAENGYSFLSEGPNYMQFQRPGTRADAIKWGGWFGEGVMVRAKIGMAKLASDSCVLQLDMYAVRDAGQGFFEDESRMIMLNKQPYRRLLRDVDKRLKAQ
jgi:hypothetical protein